MPPSSVGRRAGAVLATFALAWTALATTAAPASAGSPPTCWVVDETQHRHFPPDSGEALTAAIAAAMPGDVLALTGTCTGTYTLNKPLTLIGDPTHRFPTPTLDGNQAGTTVTVHVGVQATLTALTISGGQALSGGGGLYGQGGGTLTPYSSTVSGNGAGHTDFGAGAGAGVFNQGTVTLDSSTVSGNTTLGSAGSGAGMFNQNVMTLHSSTVSDNTAAGSLGSGGGIFNQGTLTLDTSSDVSGNTVGGSGGGIFNQGTVILDSSQVSGNSAGTNGGGISNAGTVTMHASMLSENSAVGLDREWEPDRWQWWRCLQPTFRDPHG